MVNVICVWAGTLIAIAVWSSPASAQDVSTLAPISSNDLATDPVAPDWVMPRGMVAEPGVLKRLINATDGVVKGDAARGNGLYPVFGNMITGAGFLSGGPGYRHGLGSQALVDMSIAVSSNLYKTAQARFELPRLAREQLAIGVHGHYQDLLQVNYFGLGSDSLKSDRSGYRLHNAEVFGDATVRANEWLAVGGRFGWLQKPSLSTVTGRQVAFANTVERFDEFSAPGIGRPPSFWYSDVSIVADSRDHANHPASGGIYRATAAAYSDRNSRTYSFRRYEVEASQFVPLFAKKWVLALHGWEVFSDASAGHVVPFYLMPSLGGHNTLRGYYDYRFHDTDMQSFTVESRWALFTHLDAALFADAGKVAPRARDLDFTHLRRSYGIGMRVHNASTTLARMDIGHSVEGWRVFLKLSDSFKRSTPVSGRSSIVPFVP